jgi:flavin-dependent dehydrogenase
MPCLAVTPCTSESIAVGDAAGALDPLSGNGLGSGLRTAILAAAVLDAAGRKSTSQACFDHYTRRLRDTMRSHVRSCVDFYRRIAYASAWRIEVGAMIEALHRMPLGPDAPTFLLNHGRLDQLPGAIASAEAVSGS